MPAFYAKTLLLIYFYANGISAQHPDPLQQELRLFRQEIIEKMNQLSGNQQQLRQDMTQMRKHISSLRDVSQCEHSATQIHNLVRHLKRNDEERRQQFELMFEKLSSTDRLHEKIEELDKGMRGATVKLWVIERLPGYLKNVEEKIGELKVFIEDTIIGKKATMSKGGNLVSVRGSIPDKIDFPSFDQDTSVEDAFNEIWEKVFNPLQSSASVLTEMSKEITEVLNQITKLVESQDVANSGITNLMDAIITTGENCNNQALSSKTIGKSLETQIQTMDMTLKSIEGSAEWRYNINKDALKTITSKLKDILAAVNYGATLDPGSTSVPDTRTPYQSDRNDAGKDEDRADGCAIRRLAGDVQSGVVSDDKGRAYYNRYCDQTTDGGGWTVIQRRGNFGEQLINFTATWKEYKDGFGEKYKEFWFGNDHIHRLTSEEDMVLRIELEDFDNNFVYAEYKIFKVGDETSQYRLRVGEYSGNATDSFSAHDDAMFSTVDRNNDQSPACCPCALSYGGGWWFFKCFESNLNGRWLPNPTDNGYYRGIIWEHWRGDYSLKSVTMKTRPLWFHQRIRGVGVLQDTDLLRRHY